MTTARSQGLVSCHCCGLLQQLQTGKKGQRLHCDRCNSILHSRSPLSLTKSWAFSLAAIVMLIPANLYPIMEVNSLAGSSADTILSGTLYLIRAGQYPIAAVIFIASVAVPLLKLAGMALLLTTTQRRWQLNPRQCTTLYRMVEFIGRWSMLDIFVIAILMALVNLGQIADIIAGPASTAFLCAVILTMLAASSYDPRLLWDLQRDIPTTRETDPSTFTESDSASQAKESL
ncbi:MAG: paraquat-inducible protein A [Motiliproteus sp.]